MEYSEEEFKRRLITENPGLTIEKFKLFGKQSISNDKYWLVTFGIDKGAVKFINRTSGRVRFDIGLTFINLLGQKRKVEGGI